MPVCFSVPQHPMCLCKGPPILPPHPLLFAARNAWAPVPRFSLPGTILKPKKIIRIKDPQTGHDVTEEILSSASVGRARSEVCCESISPRIPPPLMKPAVPLVVPCASRCMCTPVPQVTIPYSCLQCHSDLEQDLRLRTEVAMQENVDDLSRFACSCTLCVQVSDGNKNLEVRKQYRYSRKFLLKLRSLRVSQFKPRGLPEFILPGYYAREDSNSDKENQLLASGDHGW